MATLAPRGPSRRRAPFVRRRLQCFSTRALQADAGDGEAADEAEVWRLAFGVEREHFAELQELERLGGLDCDEVECRSAIKSAVSAAVRPLAAGVAGAPSAVAWRRSYEVLRECNSVLSCFVKPQPALSSGGASATLETREASGSDITRRGRVLDILDMASLDNRRLAEVGELRDGLGPGTLPLLAAFFNGDIAGVEALGENEMMPPIGDVLITMGLAGTPFRAGSTADWGRCIVIKGALHDPVAVAPFLKEQQRRLDDAFGEGRLFIFLQRHRYGAFLGFGNVIASEGGSPDSDRDAGDDCDRRAVLMIIPAADLPAAGEAPDGLARRLVVFASLVATVASCNQLGFQVGSFQWPDYGVWTYFNDALGAAVSRADAVGLLPVGLSLLIALAAQELGRGQAAAAHEVELRPGFFLPYPSLGCLGRTWSSCGLLPTRTAALDIAASGRSAAALSSLCLCLIGWFRGGAAKKLLFCESTRLPLFLVHALSGSYPGFGELSLGYSSEAANLLAVDPWLFGGALGLTAQAIALLPLRGLDGHTLARFALGPRPAQALEIATAMMLLIGAFGRLGPGADARLCFGALAAWAVSAFAASADAAMPPLEDFEDGSSSPVRGVASIALLAAAAAVLLPGHLVPYGILDGDLTAATAFAR